ncbi:PilN domain-containing protein [Shewanella algidipiscicola]|uniref:MSHA biogenesis protein MshI2 n=1 Tax=Shewanella algidipiscicola TaxID=614070 RepID=A0ABQ4P8Z9_9GAMM|nr:PilN domain-containing protein [Shewanella algidipiscicola]GIU43616.1 MSHA biogenesis protein MshI2 [Shewanella algidipiscicola]
MTQKLRVNLFHPSLLPHQLRLSFTRLCQVTLVLACLLLLASGITYWSVDHLQQQHAQLSGQKVDYDRQKAQLEQQIAARSASSNLVARVDLVTQQLELKRKLLGELGHVQALTSHGYSSLLTDLASVADSSTWLTRIQVMEKQFIFEGYSSAPQDVPRWVERLKRVDTLKGQAFSTLTINRGEEEPLSFVLRSEASKEPNQ